MTLLILMAVAPLLPLFLLTNHSRVECPGGSTNADADSDLDIDPKSGSYQDDPDLDSDDNPDLESDDNLDPESDNDSDDNYL